MELLSRIHEEPQAFTRNDLIDLAYHVQGMLSLGKWTELTPTQIVNTWISDELRNQQNISHALHTCDAELPEGK